MNYKIENERINEILDDLVEEYKVFLISDSVLNPQDYNNYQINISKLLRIDERIKNSLFRGEYRYKERHYSRILKRILLLFITFDVIYLFCYQFEKSPGFDLTTILLLVTIAIGLFGLHTSVVLRKFPYRIFCRNLPPEYFFYNVVNVCRKLECYLIQLTSDEENTLDSKISNLLELNILSLREALCIKNLLDLRNSITASDSDNVEKNYSVSEIKSLLDEANKIIKKFRTFENV